VDVCASLSDMKATKQLRKYFALGQRRFPSHPQFFLAEADYYLSLRARHRHFARIKHLLDKVRALAAALPPDQRANILENLEQREDDLRDSFPFGGFLGGDPMDEFWPGDEFDDDDDGDDDWED
jgi:hypothetical protein